MAIANKFIFALVGLAGGLALGILGTLHRPAPSPYRSQTNSPVRGLSAQEVENLLAGSGAGYARTAELNQHPGPLHLLELEQELEISASQAEAISAVFDQMQRDAQRLGQQIVEQEAQLSQAFATESLTPEGLDQQTQALAGLYGDLRAVHLAAHLEVTPWLTADQIERYDQLRGYSGAATPAHPHPGH